MKQIERDVKLKGEVVEVAKIDVFENEEDLDKLGLEKVLDLVNQQHSTNVCNKIRAAHREATPGKGKRYNMAFNVLPTVTFEDGSTGLEKLNECATLSDPSKRKEALDALLLSPDVQKAVDAALSAA